MVAPTAYIITMSSKSTSSHKRQRISEESKTEGQTWVLPVDGSKHNSKAFEWVAYVEVLATLEPASRACVAPPCAVM